MTLRIIDSEFGAGAGDRLGRIEKMYHRVGSDLIREDDHCGGWAKVYQGYLMLFANCGKCGAIQ